MVALCSIGVVLLLSHYGQKWLISVVEPLPQALNIGCPPPPVLAPFNGCEFIQTHHLIAINREKTGRTTRPHVINTSGGVALGQPPPRAPRTTHSIHTRHVEGDTCSAVFFSEIEKKNTAKVRNSCAEEG